MRWRASAAPPRPHRLPSHPRPPWPRGHRQRRHCRAADQTSRCPPAAGPGATASRSLAKVHRIGGTVALVAMARILKIRLINEIRLILDLQSSPSERTAPGHTQARSIRHHTGWCRRAAASRRHATRAVAQAQAQAPGPGPMAAARSAVGAAHRLIIAANADLRAALAAVASSTQAPADPSTPPEAL